MKLVPYDKFAKLRLRAFCARDALYDEFNDEHGILIREEILGAVFARLRKWPEDLVMIDLSLDDYSTNVGPPVLAALGLDLESGIPAKEVERRFGRRPRWKRKDGGYAVFDTEGDCPYEISCSYTDGAELCQLRVRRLDIEIPNQR